MVENTKIEWAHHTFNPVVGCTKVSVGALGACVHCYAESWAKRAGRDVWGDRPRQRTTVANWAQPHKWNLAAAAAGVRYRVFCASLADVFDNAWDPQWRTDLFRLIWQTPNLDWLLLTKRIGNARAMLNAAIEGLGTGMIDWDDLPFPNVWLGATIANQEEAERDIPKLLNAPARLRFLSMEPLLEAVDLTTIQHFKALGWVICGGESGPQARPLNVQWAESLREQCGAAGVPFFFKQGSHANWPNFKDFELFPESLKVREFPL